MILAISRSIGEAAKSIGVSVQTIRRWCRNGKMKVAFRTPGNHRRFADEEIFRLCGRQTEKETIGYARVSSYDQKNDLETQKEVLIKHGVNRVISDIGSGLNCHKKGLIELLHLIVEGKLSKVVIIHSDRLLRFGSELIFSLCKWKGVTVEILEKKEEKVEESLAKDVITLMTVFCARLYGARSWKNKRAVSKK